MIPEKGLWTERSLTRKERREEDAEYNIYRYELVKGQN